MMMAAKSVGGDMNEADERRYEYEAQQQRAPKPEPVYEYRVACSDGHRIWLSDASDYELAVQMAQRTSWSGHTHAVERRVIGPWEEAT
jgi:hypothetical protein